MSTSGAIRVRGTGAGAGHPRGPYVYVSGSPRRTRKRRRAVLVWVASLAVLVPVGALIQSAAADRTSDARQITAGDVVPGQQGVAQVNGDPQSASPPEPGAIDPALSRAFGKARTAALKARLDLQVTSGLRSVATQQALYDDARAKYGSVETARRWV